MSEISKISVGRKKGVFTPWQRKLIISELKIFGFVAEDQTDINDINLSGSRFLAEREKKAFINFLANNYGIMRVEIS